MSRASYQAASGGARLWRRCPASRHDAGMQTARRSLARLRVRPADAPCSTATARSTRRSTACRRWRRGTVRPGIGWPPPCCAGRGTLDAVLEPFLRRAPPGRRSATSCASAPPRCCCSTRPPHAAVATSVALAHARKLTPFAGLVNAVLRRVAEAGPAALAELDGPRLDTPPWLWASWGSRGAGHRRSASARGAARPHAAARRGSARGRLGAAHRLACATRPAPA